VRNANWKGRGLEFGLRLGHLGLIAERFRVFDPMSGRRYCPDYGLAKGAPTNEGECAERGHPALCFNDIGEAGGLDKRWELSRTLAPVVSPPSKC
jgi:hypothetical protein